MDERVRKKQRDFLAGDMAAGLEIIHYLSRSGQLDESQFMELAIPALQAYQSNPEIKRSILEMASRIQLRDVEQEDLMVAAYPGARNNRWLSVFKDHYPMASLYIDNYSDLALAWFWLYNFYTTGIFESKSREIYDISLQERVILPP